MRAALAFLHGERAVKCSSVIEISWILRKGDFIVPIPGMRKEERVRENLAAADITLTDAEFAALEKALDGITIHGNRTDKDIEKLGTVRAS